MFRDVRRWRGRLQRRREPSGVFGTLDNRRKRLENSARNGGRESDRRWNRFRSRRQGATVVSRSFGDPLSGGAVLVTMEGARVILALHACFERRLPAGTKTRRALREHEHANNRRHPFQDRPHVSRMRYHWHSVNARSGPSRPLIARADVHASVPRRYRSVTRCR